MKLVMMVMLEPQVVCMKDAVMYPTWCGSVVPTTYQHLTLLYHSPLSYHQRHCLNNRGRRTLQARWGSSSGDDGICISRRCRQFGLCGMRRWKGAGTLFLIIALAMAHSKTERSANENLKRVDRDCQASDGCTRACIVSNGWLHPSHERASQRF